MRKRIIIISVALVVLVAALCVFYAVRTPVPVEVELKYDDGRPNGLLGVGGATGLGFIVNFSPPKTSMTVDKIRIFGALTGHGYEGKISEILIRSEDRTELYRGSFQHTRFTHTPGWVEIEIPGVVVYEEFDVILVTDTPKESGLYIGYDTSVENEYSGLVRNWESSEWYLDIPKERINWMIRVVGTTI
jgi:hypothetical protein